MTQVTGSSISKNGGNATEAIREKASDLRDDVASVSRQVRDTAKEQWENISDTASEQTKHLVKLIKQRPLASVGVACAAGMVLSVLFRRS